MPSKGPCWESDEETGGSQGSRRAGVHQEIEGNPGASDKGLEDCVGILRPFQVQLKATRVSYDRKVEIPNLLGPGVTSRQSLRKKEEEAAQQSSHLGSGARSSLESRWTTGIQVV
jgi:hypothetical protein